MPICIPLLGYIAYFRSAGEDDRDSVCSWRAAVYPAPPGGEVAANHVWPPACLADFRAGAALTRLPAAVTVRGRSAALVAQA